MSDLNADLASAILRIEQAYAERHSPLGELLLRRLLIDARRLRGHLSPESVLGASAAREAALAALAGAAVDRLFLGGPLDGQIHTMARHQLDAVAPVPQPITFSAIISEQAQALEVCHYHAVRFAVAGADRYVMVAPGVRDLDRALFDWLASRWVLEAPDHTL